MGNSDAQNGSTTLHGAVSDKRGQLRPEISRGGPLPTSVQPQFIHASEARTRATLICKQTEIFTFNNITAAYMRGSRKILHSRNIIVIITLRSAEKVRDLCAKFREIGLQTSNKHRQKGLVLHNPDECTAHAFHVFLTLYLPLRISTTQSW